MISDAITGGRGPGGPRVPPKFGRTVNPIPIGEGRLSPPPYYCWHPQCFSPSGITDVNHIFRADARMYKNDIVSIVLPMKI